MTMRVKGRASAALVAGCRRTAPSLLLDVDSLLSMAFSLDGLAGWKDGSFAVGESALTVLLVGVASRPEAAEAPSLTGVVLGLMENGADFK